MVAVNHARAQILAPHREADPWAGLDRAGEPSARPEAGAAGGTWDSAWPENDRIG